MWTQSDVEELTKNYREYPLKIDERLVLVHGKAGCYTKASDLGLSHRLRSNKLDLSKWSVATKAYLAGIIDGEGSIVIVKNNRTYKKTGMAYIYERPVISVVNTSEILLAYLNNLHIGGFSRERRRVERCKRTFQWMISGVMPIHSVLKAVAPYLVIKKAKAEEVIAWIENRYEVV